MIGVGTVLESWIPTWAIASDRTACDCNKVRDEMDALGPDRVEADLQKYVEHFVHQRKYLRKTLRVAPEFVIRAWVELVIKNACDKVRKDAATKPNRRR